ncbi:MAG: hypothetical protein ACFFAI_01955 [Promethearchaeota archaeon]
MLELEELAENRESACVGRSQELANKENQNQRLRELRVSMLYNQRYLEERERNLINHHVLRVSYSHNR